MDGVAISIIGRPRPLPGHDTPNAAHNTYTLKCEEPDIRMFPHYLTHLKRSVLHTFFPTTAPLRLQITTI